MDGGSAYPQPPASSSWGQTEPRSEPTGSRYAMPLAWTDAQPSSSAEATYTSESMPPLPPEPDESPPPLPPEEDPPPLPPPVDTRQEAYGSRHRQNADTDASASTAHGANWASLPWQQQQQAALATRAWQPAPQAFATSSAPAPSGAYVQQNAATDRMPVNAPTRQGFEGPAHDSQQPTSTSYGQWSHDWRYSGYQGYTQPPQEHHAYGSYAGYELPGQDHHSSGYSAQPPPWAQPQYAPTPEAHGAPWLQTSAAPAAPHPAPPEPVEMTANEVDAEDLFFKPGRDKRPRKLAVLMRGLPGSGKTHLAKKLKEVEADHGGEAPRIHAIDDYFVTEVEREVVEQEPGKKPRKRTVTAMEYLYEPELEGSYKLSILKAFTKTVEEGRFQFVILDAPNTLVEDFRPFYLAAQRTGYAVYVVKPVETDPAVCFKRNVHSRELDAIASLAAAFEPTPRLYTQLLVESLLDLPKPPAEEVQAIEEVDMEDEGSDGGRGEPVIRSRWAALEDEGDGATSGGEEAPKRKRRKRGEAEPEEASSLVPPGKVAVRQAATSILRKPGSAPSGKSLRWADEGGAAEGFTISGRIGRQLTVVYHLEGLGPGSREDHPSQHGSFQEHAKADRKSEGKTFRDILFGGPRP